jgi:LruC domain-containing protein
MVVLLAGCSFGPAAVGYSPKFQLPADRVADIPRAVGAFSFQTVAPVDVALGVDLYQATGGAKSAAPSGTDQTPVFVSITDLGGQELVSAMLHHGQRLNTRLYVPAGSNSVFLRLRAPGYESRSVEISNPSALATIDRQMGLASSETPAPQDAVLDRDEDGVPNLYDAAPDDPLIAFIVQMKGQSSKTGTTSSGCITLAFEDNYPSLGDGDFNDFVAQLDVTEYFAGPKNGFRMTSLQVNAFAISKNAGYDHTFGLAIHYPGLTADVDVVRSDADGNVLASETTLAVAEKAAVTLFTSTEQAAAPNRAGNPPDPNRAFHGYTSRLRLTGLTTNAPAIDPAAGDLAGLDRMTIEAPPYDPYIVVHQNGRDIHMIGKTALNGTPTTFIDGAGNPWVLAVPSDWAHPAETKRIGTAYLDFDAWVASRGADHCNWYDRETANVNSSLIVTEAYPLPAIVPTGL